MSNGSDVVNDILADTITKVIKEQPRFIIENKINVKRILEEFSDVVKHFFEYHFTKQYADALKEFLDVSAIRTSMWCFVKLKGSVEKKFFFECAKLERNEEIFLREVSEECPYPEAKPPVPPTADTCKMYYKRGKQVVEGILQAVGQGTAEQIIECLVTATFTQKKPDVATLCSNEAVVEEYEQMSGKDREELKNESGLDLKNGLQQSIVGETKTVTTQAPKPKTLAKVTTNATKVAKA